MLLSAYKFLILCGGYGIHSKLHLHTGSPQSASSLISPNLYFLLKLHWTLFPVQFGHCSSCLPSHPISSAFLPRMLLLLQAPAQMSPPLRNIFDSPSRFKYLSSHKTCWLDMLIMCFSIYLLQESVRWGPHSYLPHKISKHSNIFGNEQVCGIYKSVFIILE